MITHRASDGKMRYHVFHVVTRNRQLFQISPDITLQPGFCQRVNDPLGRSVEGWWFQN